MKAKLLKVLGLFVIPPSTVFTLLNLQDKGLKVINIEGSGSLYEPILFLTKDHQLDTELNVLPTGSAGGKEALTNKSTKLALTSLSSTQQSSVSKEAQLAEDPIYLVHKKGAKCSLLSNTHRRNGLLSNLFQQPNGCKNLVLFLREGGLERSNLNKTVISENQLKSLGTEVIIRELPENNFLAYERFNRENYADSVIFFPHSFIQLNKELFSDYGQIKLEGTQADSPKLKKELNLLFNSEDTSKVSKLKELISQILLKSDSLRESFNLRPRAWNDNGELSCLGKNIEDLFKESRYLHVGGKHKCIERDQ